MKNIKIKLWIIAWLFITTISNANRDAVSEVSYKWNIHNPYNLQITTINTACDNKESIYLDNVFPVLNFWSNTWLNCVKTWLDNVTCDKSIPTDGPSSSFNDSFYVYSTYKTLATKLGLPEKIINNLSWNYSQNFTLKMLLSTDSNWWDMNQMTYFDFSKIANPFSVTINYSDQKECSNKCAKNDILDRAWSIIWQEEKCESFKIIDIISNTPTLDITDNKKPSKFWNVKIEWCNEISGEYYCLAKTSIDFKVSLSELWFDWTNSQWINSLKVGVNNRANTSQLSTNSWKNFADFIQTANYTSNISISDNYFEQKGTYTLEISGKWWNWAYIYQITPIYKKLHILPNNDFKVASTSVSSTSLYWNNSDNYIVTANITDSFGNKLDTNYAVNEASIIWEWFDINKIDSWFQWEWLKISWSDFSSNKFTFDLKSVVPWSKSVNFKIAIPEHEMISSLPAKITKKELNFSENIIFNKPFITTDFSIENASKRLEIWPSLNMVLTWIINKWFSTEPSYSINDFSNNIKLTDNTNHRFEKFPSSIQTNNLKYSFTIDAATNAGLNIAPSINLDKNPVISYTLDWKEIKYYINKSTDPNNDDKLSLSWVKWISWIKIVGTAQTTWKAATTNNIVNFSDLSKSTLRLSVKKNVSLLTKWLSAEKLVNGVIYYNGNKKISDINLAWVETLIIKNWNLIIDSNNLGWIKEKFGIIVTRDDNSKTNLWNIYLTPWVTYIKASIYADGWLISSNYSGSPYTSDTDERTNELEKQLIIKWSILTRNTIGWAVKWDSWKYILPGWEQTTDFNKAMMYDLNYLRRSNNWWDSITNKTLNNNNSNNVVIIYNSSIQTNPPKWFTAN